MENNSENSHDDLIKEEIESNTRSLGTAVILIMISCFVQLLVSGIYTYNSYEDRREHSKEAQVSREFKMLEYQFSYQNRKYEEIEYPMIALRDKIEKMYSLCSKPPTSGNIAEIKEVREAIREDKVKLGQGFSGTQMLFNKQIFDELVEFVSEIYKIQDSDKICPTSLKPGEYWKLKARVIEAGMLQEMGKTELAMKKIINMN